MSMQDAREFLDYYLDLEGDPEFAVLLEGPWGAGKSHFVDAYFRDRFDKQIGRDPTAKDPLIHVTLFGVRDLSDITTQMFEKAHPILGGKTVKVLNTVASKLGGVIGLGLDPKENSALIESMTLNLEGRVLVFDDLERSPLPLVEVMGFINRFVEHNKIKVIVVASEADIPQDQQEEYRKRKEKLVGKTIKVRSDPGSVLDFFVKRLKCAPVLNAIKARRSELLATFEASGRPNYRSLRAVLLDYDRLVSLTDTRLRESSEAMEQLLLHMIALGTEFRRNGIDYRGLTRLQSDMNFMRFGRSVKPEDTEEVQAERLRTDYPLVDFDDPLVDPKHLADLFASGIFEVEDVNAHLAQHPLIVGPADVPSWRLMWDWHERSYAAYQVARDRLVDDLKKRRLTNPGHILHAGGSVLQLRRYGDDLIDGRAPLEYFSDYLNDLESARTLEAAPNLFGNWSGSYGGLGYGGRDEPEFEAFRELVRKAAERALERDMLVAAPNLVARLRNDPRDVQMLSEWGLEKSSYGGVAILHNIKIPDFADLVLVDGKPNDRLLGALGERYRHGSSPILEQERAWLAQLCKELLSRADALLPPYKSFATQRLNHWFEEFRPFMAADA